MHSKFRSLGTLAATAVLCCQAVDASFVRSVVTAVNRSLGGVQLTVYTLAARFDGPSDTVYRAYGLVPAQAGWLGGFWHKGQESRTRNRGPGIVRSQRPRTVAVARNLGSDAHRLRHQQPPLRLVPLHRRPRPICPSPMSGSDSLCSPRVTPPGFTRWATSSMSLGATCWSGPGPSRSEGRFRHPPPLRCSDSRALRTAAVVAFQAERSWAIFILPFDFRAEFLGPRLFTVKPGVFRRSVTVPVE